MLRWLLSAPCWLIVSSDDLQQEWKENADKNLFVTKIVSDWTGNENNETALI